MLLLMQQIDSAAPHLFIARSGEGHLEVVEPGRPNGVEPVDHLLETTASTQRQSHTDARCHAASIYSVYRWFLGEKPRGFFLHYLWLHTNDVQSRCCSAVDISE